MEHSDKEASLYTKKAAVLKKYCKNVGRPKTSIIPHKKSYEEQLADEYIKKFLQRLFLNRTVYGSIDIHVSITRNFQNK